MRRLLLSLFVLAMTTTAFAQSQRPERIAYGKEPSQFGELWLPAGTSKAPVAVMIHGGCWFDSYGLDLMDGLSADLRGRGVAVWNLEYRRLGETGAGYPGTFQDVAAAADALRGLATRYPLDLGHVVAIGHSAGGHLALWAAARGRLPAASPLQTPDPLPIGFVVTLAGIDDLAAYHENGPACGGAGTIDRLINVRGRGDRAYADTSPRALLPLGLPQLIVSGAEDGIVPAHFGRDYAAAGAAAGDQVTAVVLPGADHFALIAPGSDAWAKVRSQVLAAVGLRPNR